MRRSLKNVLTITAVVAGLAGGPALYAHAHESGEGSGGMMGQGGMMQGGQGGMMGQMNQMMENCNKMMQSMQKGDSGKPNEQWRKQAPEADKAPERKD